MDPNRIEVTYRGHKITVDVTEVHIGLWGWSYLVDGKFYGSMRGTLRSTREEALKQGLAAAKARVGEL